MHEASPCLSWRHGNCQLQGNIVLNALACQAVIGHSGRFEDGLLVLRVLSVRHYPVRCGVAQGNSKASLLRRQSNQSSPQHLKMMLSRGARTAARSSTRLARGRPRRFDSHSAGQGESAGHGESAFRVAGGSGSESMGVREDDSTHHPTLIDSVTERFLCSLSPGSFINGRLLLRIIFRHSRPYPYHRRLSITRRRSRPKKHPTSNSL